MRNLSKNEQDKLALKITEEEHESYMEQHTKICPSCGKTATDIGVNGAGIEEELNRFHCDYCGWNEDDEESEEV